MERRTLSLRVGFLLLATLVLAVGAIIALSGNQLSDSKKYETYFRESVQGLDVGAPVKFRGVPLGRVTNIGLVSAEYGATAQDQAKGAEFRLIVVRFKVDPKRIGRMLDTASAVNAGLRAHLASQGLTGVMYLELDFVPPDQPAMRVVPWEPQDDYIPSIPSTIVQVQDMVVDVLHKFDSVDFEKISQHLDGLLISVQAQLAKGGDVQATLADAHKTIDSLQTQLAGADLPGISVQLKKTLAALQNVSDGAKTRQTVAASRADRGLSDTEDELLPILRDAKATMQNLRETSEILRRDPGRVLWQQDPKRDGK